MYRKLFLCLAWLLGSGFSVLNNRKPTIFLVGDSTVASFAERYAPMMGWGQEFQQFFRDDITVDNRALAGKSSRSFIEEGKWSRVMQDIRPGDYLLIQFGHNDQKKDYRYTEPYGTYQKFLTHYIRETRDQGGIPILLTPVMRRRFREAGELFDTHGEYPAAVRQLATQLDVPLIDLHQRSFVHFAQLGKEATKEIFLWLAPGEEKNYPAGLEDNTHFSRNGAQEVGKLVIEGLQELDLPLKNYRKGCRQEIAETMVICEGDSVRIGSSFRTEAGEYRHEYLTREGCDSTVITKLEVVPTRFAEQSLVIAEGDSVWIGQQYRYRAGIYLDTLRSKRGCDSVITTTLRVISSPAETHRTISLCAGDSLRAGGSYRKESGVYYDTLTTSSGGDSIIITALAIANPVPLPTVVAEHNTLRSNQEGDAYQWFLDGHALADTTATLAAGSAGNYSVTVRVGTCTSLPSEAYYYAPVVTGIDRSIASELPLRVSWSAADSYLTIESPLRTKRSAKMYIHNLSGRRVFFQENPVRNSTSTTFRQKISFFGQPEGIYIVTLVASGQRSSAKFYWSR